MVAPRFVGVAALVAMLFVFSEASNTAIHSIHDPCSQTDYDTSKLIKWFHFKPNMTILDSKTDFDLRTLYVTCSMVSTRESDLKKDEDVEKCRTRKIDIGGKSYDITQRSVHRLDDKHIVLLETHDGPTSSKILYTVFDVNKIHMTEKGQHWSVKALHTDKIAFDKLCYKSRHVNDRTIYFGHVALSPLTKQESKVPGVNAGNCEPLKIIDTVRRDRRVFKMNATRYSPERYELYQAEDDEFIFTTKNPFTKYVRYWYFHQDSFLKGGYPICSDDGHGRLIYERPHTGHIVPYFFFANHHYYENKTVASPNGVRTTESIRLMESPCHSLESLEAFISAFVVAFIMTNVCIITSAYLCLRVIPSAKARIKNRGDSAITIDKSLLKEVMGGELPTVNAKSDKSDRSKEAKTQTCSADGTEADNGTSTCKSRDKTSKKSSKTRKASRKESKDHNKSKKLKNHGSDENEGAKKKDNKAKNAKPGADANAGGVSVSQNVSQLNLDTREISKTLKDY
ncbi:hypothetical protein QR680_010539 [Steinernema hermaphroditum]|uniref:Uncharacterized protein n=1 Tax=Steinernema hermaphroditum TaxID=289476 RepID=A0AA39IQU0_9BILA|nr:hypothetical protein QR680_010539 [Steinernema hermaphroditum]